MPEENRFGGAEWIVISLWTVDFRKISQHYEFLVFIAES